MKKFLFSLMAMMCLCLSARAAEELEYVFCGPNYHGSSPSSSWVGQGVNANGVFTCDGNFKMSWPNYTLSESENALSWTYSGVCTVTASPGVTISEIDFVFRDMLGDPYSLANNLQVSSGAITVSGSKVVWKGSVTTAAPLELNKPNNTQIKLIDYIVVKYSVDVSSIVVPAPAITPNGGEVDQFSDVTVSSIDGATIEYSLSNDGTENWQEYTKPVKLTEAGTWTFKARASFKGVVSEVSEATFVVNSLTSLESGFVINSTAYSKYTGDLPTIEITTNPKELTEAGLYKADVSGLTNNSGYINFSAGNKITITPDENVSITRVYFKGYSSYYKVDGIEVSDGKMVFDGTNGEWTGNSKKELVFTSTQNISYMTYVLVEYTKDLSGGGEEDAAGGITVCINGADKFNGDGAGYDVVNFENDGNQFIVPGVATLSWNDEITINTSPYNAAYKDITFFNGAKFTVAPVGGINIKKIGLYFYKWGGASGVIAGVNTGVLSEAVTGNNYIVAEWTGSSNAPIEFDFAKTTRNLYGLVIEYEKGEVEVEVVTVPTITPAAGTYKVGQKVTITADEGCTIQYSATLDGTEDFKAYTEPFELDNVGEWTVKARAMKGANPSEYVTVKYTVEYLDVAKPVITPESGTYNAGQTVTVAATEGAVIQYSLTNDGTENWKEYTEPVVLTRRGAWTFKAKAYVGISPSEVAVAEYVVPKSEASLSFGEETYQAYVGMAFTAPAIVNPNGLNVKWSSDNEGVAKVNAATGVIEIISAGSATITATFDGNEDYEAGSASYSLMVLRQSAEFKFAKTQVECVYGEAFTGPELINTQNLNVTWRSNNEKVATVNAQGQIKIYEPGVVTITAIGAQTAVYNMATAAYTLTVFDANAEIMDVNATIVVEDYYYDGNPGNSPRKVNIGGTTQSWKEFEFTFGPQPTHAIVNYNYRALSTGGSIVYPSYIHMSTNSEITIEAPVGATMKSIKFNLFNKDRHSEVTVNVGELSQPAGANVEWTGNAKSVTFNVITGIPAGVDILSIDIDYEQKMAETARLIYVEFDGEKYLDGQSITASPDDVITVTAPMGFEQISWQRKFSNGQYDGEEQVAEGNKAEVTLDKIGAYVYTFAASRNNGQDVIVASFNITVAVESNPDSSEIDFTTEGAYGLPVSQIGQYGYNRDYYCESTNGEAVVTLVQGQKTALVEYDGGYCLEVGYDNAFKLDLKASRRIVSIEFTGENVSGLKAASNATTNPTEISGVNSGIWVAPTDADYRYIGFWNRTMARTPVYVKTIKINTDVNTIVMDVAADEAEAEYYNLNGQRVAGNHLQPGIYVKRVGSKTTKIMVK